MEVIFWLLGIVSGTLISIWTTKYFHYKEVRITALQAVAFCCDPVQLRRFPTYNLIFEDALHSAVIALSASDQISPCHNLRAIGQKFTKLLTAVLINPPDNEWKNDPPESRFIKNALLVMRDNRHLLDEVANLKPDILGILKPW